MDGALKHNERGSPWGCGGRATFEHPHKERTFTNVPFRAEGVGTAGSACAPKGACWEHYVTNVLLLACGDRATERGCGREADATGRGGVADVTEASAGDWV